MVAADYHSWDSRMMLSLDAVVAVQSCHCLLHDIVLVRARAAGPHAPYLPYWLLPVQRPAAFSICFVDFETIFWLVFRWDEVMLLSQPVPMNSGTWWARTKKKKWNEFPKNESAIWVRITFLNRTSIPIEKLVLAKRRFEFSFFASIAWNHLHLAIRYPMVVRDYLGHRPQ